MRHSVQRVRSIAAERLVQRKREFQVMILIAGAVVIGSAAWGYFATPTTHAPLLLMVTCFVGGAMLFSAAAANAVLLVLRCAVARYRRMRHVREERFAVLRAAVQHYSSASIDAIAHWLQQHQRAQRWFWVATAALIGGFASLLAFLALFGNVPVHRIPGWAVIAAIASVVGMVAAAGEASIRAGQIHIAQRALRDLRAFGQSSARRLTLQD